MNNGLNGEGKDIIKDVGNKDNKLADNLTKFYSNEELSNNNQTTSMYSGQVTLNQNNNSKLDKFNSIEAPTDNASNPVFDFIKGLKNDIKKFLNFKKIESEEDYNNRMNSAANITVVILLVASSEFIFLYGSNILKFILTIAPVVLLATGYISLKDHNRRGILLGIIASLLLICSLKPIIIILSVIYLIGLLLLLRYKKKTQ